MATSKPWYLSRTIWASIITILTGTAGLTGIPVEGIDSSAFTDTIIAVFGRLSAKERIG